MPLALQAKLLRVIESRAGDAGRGARSRGRSTCASSPPPTAISRRRSRAARSAQDLYFRLNGVALTIPPLRERLDEIEPLARLFLERRRRGRLPRDAGDLRRSAGAGCAAYPWPGNIRELRNVIERALLLGVGRADHARAPAARRSYQAAPGRPRRRGPTRRRPPAEPAAGSRPPGGRPAARSSEQAILDALERCAGNQTRAAEYLGLPRRTFCSRLREYNIPRPRA